MARRQPRTRFDGACAITSDGTPSFRRMARAGLCIHAMNDHELHLVRLGIDTHQEPIVYMRADCHVCRSEGFTAHSRVRVETDHSALVATLNVVQGNLLKLGEAGLSEAAWGRLEA